jgi:hypothetical protein
MEPTLESISDYDTLKGEKKRVVWMVVIIGIVIGIAYTVAAKVFTPDDAISVKEAFVTRPFGRHEMPVK